MTIKNEAAACVCFMSPLLGYDDRFETNVCILNEMVAAVVALLVFMLVQWSICVFVYI